MSSPHTLSNVDGDAAFSQGVGLHTYATPPKASPEQPTNNSHKDVGCFGADLLGPKLPSNPQCISEGLIDICHICVYIYIHIYIHMMGVSVFRLDLQNGLSFPFSVRYKHETMTGTPKNRRHARPSSGPSRPRRPRSPAEALTRRWEGTWAPRRPRIEFFAANKKNARAGIRKKNHASIDPESKRVVSANALETRATAEVFSWICLNSGGVLDNNPTNMEVHARSVYPYVEMIW